MTFDLMSYLTLVGFCITLGDYFDKKDSPINNSMKELLKRSKNFNYFYIKEICKTFIKSFDYIYVDNFKSPRVSYWFWVFIFISWGIALSFTFLVPFVGISSDSLIPTETTNLMCISFGSLVFIIGLSLVIFLKAYIPRFNYLFDQIILIIKKETQKIFSSYSKDKFSQIEKLNYFYDLKLFVKQIKNIITGGYDDYKSSQSSLVKGFFVSSCMATLTFICIMVIVLIIKLMCNSMLQLYGLPEISILGT